MFRAVLCWSRLQCKAWHRMHATPAPIAAASPTALGRTSASRRLICPGCRPRVQEAIHRALQDNPELAKEMGSKYADKVSGAAGHVRGMCVAGRCRMQMRLV
jgi:hypothetical protein